MKTDNEEFENIGFANFVKKYLIFLEKEVIIDDLKGFELEPILDVTNDLLDFFNYLDNKQQH